jgi:two-component system nitrogen regulation sensor histidine kinase GlnL
VLEHVKRLASVRLRPQRPHPRGVRPVAAAGDANRNQLIQVFLNLVKNAVEAIGDARMARSS